MMLMQKLLWMKESENLDAEIRECTDEGRKIDDLIPQALSVKAMPDGVEKEERAAALMLEMERRPLIPGFPYQEPDSYREIQASLTGSPRQTALPPAHRREKIFGAWLGRAIGCTLGIPVEGWKRADICGYALESGQFPIRSFLHSDVTDKLRQKYHIHDDDPNTPYGRKTVCWANNLTGEFPVDDDINYTVLALQVMEQYGKNFTAADVAEAWLYGLPAMHACTAERVAYRNLLHRRMPPVSAKFLNPFREWIGAQIRVDPYGYIAAGDPMLAAELAYRDASLAQTKNGIYAAMYIAALISAASVISDYTEAVHEALLCIPPKARLSEALQTLLHAYSSGQSFSSVIDGIHSRYHEYDAFDWCHAIPNTLIVTACVLWHGYSYEAAITHAVQCGFDTDCNGATTGSIVGISLGADGIPVSWQNLLAPILHTTISGAPQITIEDAAARTIALMA